jgi:hypothetical protein
VLRLGFVIGRSDERIYTDWATSNKRFQLLPSCIIAEFSIFWMNFITVQIPTQTRL